MYTIFLAAGWLALHRPSASSNIDAKISRDYLQLQTDRIRIRLMRVSEVNCSSKWKNNISDVVNNHESDSVLSVG